MYSLRELIHTILIVNKCLYLLIGVTGSGLYVQSRILAHIHALQIEEEVDALNLKSSVLVRLPQHGGMGSSRLIFYSPILGPSGYPTDLVTGQPSLGAVLLLASLASPVCYTILRAAPC